MGAASMEVNLSFAFATIATIAIIVTSSTKVTGLTFKIEAPIEVNLTFDFCNNCNLSFGIIENITCPKISPNLKVVTSFIV